MSEKGLFDRYVEKLKTEKKFDSSKKAWVLKAEWVTKKKDDFFSDCWNNILASGLEFDGKHITLTERGVSYDYVAYKNKMLQVYPETKIDTGIVYKGDVFLCGKENGVITYSHQINSPFGHNDDDIVGAYCAIKNKRGDFIVTLSKQEIEKAKRKAKTDTIWKEWYSDMVLKTVIRKAVKFHFDDVYTSMDDEDNKNYDMDKPLVPELSEALVNAIEAAETVQSLKDIYTREYASLPVNCKKEFTKLLSTRKQKIQATPKQPEANVTGVSEQ